MFCRILLILNCVDPSQSKTDVLLSASLCCVAVCVQIMDRLGVFDSLINLRP